MGLSYREKRVVRKQIKDFLKDIDLGKIDWRGRAEKRRKEITEREKPPFSQKDLEEL